MIIDKHLLHTIHKAITNEDYSTNNSYLLRYLKAGGIDIYSFGYELQSAIDNEEIDHNEVYSALEKAGIDVETLDDLTSEYDLDWYQYLPERTRKSFEDDALNTRMMYDPQEAPSTAYFSDAQLVKRNTLLIHFSDDADIIQDDGFTYGIDDMDRLGLTTYFKKSAMKYGGYNFAFIANSKYAKYAQDKYGKDAVLFTSGGVRAWHSGDEEEQVMFWGKNVDPRNIVLIKSDYEDHDWAVIRCDKNHNGDVAFGGSFDKVIEWVSRNYNQYKNVITKGY